MKEGFALWLWHTRKGKDLSMRQLAALSGMSLGMISDIENGRKRPGPETVSAFLDALDVNEKDRKRVVRMAAKEAGWKLI